jgi:hypothetical protein
VRELNGENDNALYNLAVARTSTCCDPMLAAAEAAREAGNTPTAITRRRAAGPKRVDAARNAPTR